MKLLSILREHAFPALFGTAFALVVAYLIVYAPHFW